MDQSNLSLNPREFIAHYCERDRRIQTVETHLRETAAAASNFAEKIGLPLCGRLLGLCHDLGKYSEEFQIYIREGCGFFGEEGRKNAKIKKGTIDHATAGAQLVWQSLPSDRLSRSLAQTLSVALMSHHSSTGMKDFISLDGKSPFLKRLATKDDRTHLDEARQKADSSVVDEIERILISPDLKQEFKILVTQIGQMAKSKTACLFSYGLLVRFLFSALLDADRINTANFEKQKTAQFRISRKLPDWLELAKKLDGKLVGFPVRNKIDEIRNRISEECLSASNRSERLFTLTVPTGGGKTLASLRFALHRAAQATTPRIDRIIYVVPYTTIIDQNAREVRNILGKDNVLEHHSNIIPEIDDWRNRVLSENWNAPIVFTTSVQLLNALFGQTTSSARRMHQLANAIIIFDEIQALPIKVVHSFNHAINFLTTTCNTTAVFCTATQPLFDSVNPLRGAVKFSNNSEIISDKAALFRDLKRTEIIDKTRPEKWSHTEIRNFAAECMVLHQSVLIVCNTKDSALRLFDALRETKDALIIHLSTSMCPAHRREKIDEIKARLDPENARPLICISTQLIEAGVDLDFGCVIRSLAGMDSIAQAGGRCNRNGNREIGYVYILNFGEEKLGPALSEISEAQQVTLRVLGEFKSDPKFFKSDLLSEDAMKRYYEYYFFIRSEDMIYPLKAGKGKPPIAVDTSMLALLTENHAGREFASEDVLSLPLQQAFSTAAQAFQLFDAPTVGIIVPYGKDGTKLIADMSAAFATEDCPLYQQISLIKKAQQFTVNVFPYMIEKLTKECAIREIQPESQIYYLDERHYHKDLGVTLEALSEQHFLNVS